MTTPTANPVPSQAATDLLFNAERIDQLLNGEESSYTDRFGRARRTIAALEAEYPNAQANADAAAGSAEAASSAKALAQAAKAQAETAKTQAEAARDAAAVNGKVYATTAAGLAATSGAGDANRYFSVPSSDSSEYLILYLNSAGAAVEQKRYQSSITGVDGAYNLVNPAAPVMIGGLNGLANWDPNAAYNSIAIRVEAGASIVLNNTANLYVGEFRAAFFSALPPSAGTRISGANSAAIKNNNGDFYLAEVVPVGAKYIVVNVRFNAASIDWFVARGMVYSGRSAFEPEVGRVNELPIFDIGIRKDFQTEEGDENLYNAINNLADQYVTSNYVLGASSAAQAWRVAVIPVEEGKMYAVHFGPVMTSGNWRYGIYANGIRQANSLGPAAKVLYSDTLNPSVKTFIVPTGQGITHAFINAKVGGDDHTATMIVQIGSTVPVIPLAYSAALPKVGARLIKDRTARSKIANLMRRTASGTRFVGKKFYHFGDSITEGTEGGYVKYVQNVVQCISTNYGSSGARTGRLVALATDQLNRQEVGGPATNPDYTGVAGVTIMIGTNDINGGAIGSLVDIPAKSLQDVPFTPAGGPLVSTPDQYWALFPNTFYGNVGLVIEYIKYRNANTLIYLVSPPHNTAYDMTVIRAALAALAKFYSIRFIDAQDEAGLERKQFMKYSYDGSHLNVLGNDLWGNYVGHRIAHS
ncbi:SGNH/GDSL hydrolase family protein [Acidovorax sp. Be4]|uniref:SGNH/GDSL hydrolase family protein n=1 Tax=Acidovorax bellezanensis TaxID=2976702 RepID=A0ABT2PTF7_9BURK|nr:SGNH/GDSL hydrolase family protein [Acidovorax sp. Be4]MCT9812408.1 SGNH/GDSL hydrolase family protein [Acidovorax sp. Be4]